MRWQQLRTFSLHACTYSLELVLQDPREVCELDAWHTQGQLKSRLFVRLGKARALRSNPIALPLQAGRARWQVVTAVESR